MATDLIVEERIPYVFCNSGGNLNIVWTFLVVLCVDAITEDVGLIPDQPESAGRESVRWQAMANSDHILEQLRPSLVLLSIPERIVTVLL